MMKTNFLKNSGPGVLIAAAFIGPGTVTVCTLAGAHHGFVLLWAMLFSIFATLILQSMSVKVGIICPQGLPQVIKSLIPNAIVKFLVVALILAAILVGNAAYEAGNISGAVLGLELITKNTSFTFLGYSVKLLNLIIGLIAFVLLFLGNYKLLERTLIGLVLLMSLSFVLTAIFTQPNLLDVVKGLLIPKIPEGSLLLVVALIGTTVVPYNLFLHAALSKEKWGNNTDKLTAALKDSKIAILMGGVISISIIISAAAIKGTQVTQVTDLALGLEPIYGEYARYFLALGLLAAGITSAITAPLAAAYVAQGLFFKNSGLRSSQFRLVWILVLFTGIVFSSTGIKPIDIIKFAQFTNGLLLPFIAFLLLWVTGFTSILGSYKNSKIHTIFASIVVLITFVLGFKSLGTLFSWF